MTALAGLIDSSSACRAGGGDGRACLEQLEPRLLLSSAPEGFWPSDIRHAYGIDSVSFDAGAIAGTGAGQTIAIVAAFDDPTVLADMKAFDRAFNLPDPPKFTVIGQTGTSTLPGTDPVGPGDSWALETAMDVEWAHAVAPGANILLVEANSDFEDDLIAASDVARKRAGVSVVSLSWGEDEYLGESSEDSHFTTPRGHNGVTFLTPAGDNGAQMMYPSSSPNVVSVGGTTLSLDGDGNYLSETGWGNDGQSNDLGGSGGGISAYEPQPAYQKGVVTQSDTWRTGPDVAFDADPDTGVAVYDSWDNGKSSPWTVCAGTSLGCPAWAGIIAIADQGRVLAGMGTLDGAPQTLPMIYSLPSQDFHDITTGDNGYSAAAGYDLVTGLGTPIVNLLVKGLIPPKAANDAVTIDDTNDPNTIDVLANDTDANGSSITIIAASDASHGTVSFSGGDVTYTLSDLSAHSDSFTYTVSDSYGGTSTATVNILVAFDNPDMAIGSGQAAQTLAYTDPDGTAVTVSVVKGTADVHLTGTGLTILGTTNLTINGSAELGQIVLSGTTAASSLKITTKGGQDNLATLGGLTGSTPLGKLTAPGIDLVDQGVTMTGGGTIASLTLHDVNADVTMPGAGAGAGVTIAAKLISSCTITLGAPLATLTAIQWNAGSLTSPSVGTISIKGDKTQSLPGDMDADITLSGANAKGVALGKLSIAGTIDAAIAAQEGAVGSITARGWTAGSLTAEAEGQLTLASDCGADITLSGVGVAAGKPALGAANIKGPLTGGTWTVHGSTGAISVSGIDEPWGAAIDGAMKSLSSKGNVAGAINALSIGTFKITGDLDGAAINLTQAPLVNDPKVRALGSLSVSGAMNNATLVSAGNLGTVSLGRMIGSTIFAGVDINQNAVGTLPDTVADFDAAARLDSLTITGIKGQAVSFDNSFVASQTLGSISLMDLPTDGSAGGGVAGVDLLKTYRRKAGKSTASTSKGPLTAATILDHLDNYVARLV